MSSEFNLEILIICGQAQANESSIVGESEGILLCKDFLFNLIFKKKI